jgi:hypothetical protein
VSAHAQPASMVLTPLMRQQLEGQTRALIAESEIRQRQMLTNAVGRIWQDSDRQLQQFVKRAQFDSFRNRELPANVNYAVQQALMQQGGRQ